MTFYRINEQDFVRENNNHNYYKKPNSFTSIVIHKDNTPSHYPFYVKVESGEEFDHTSIATREEFETYQKAQIAQVEKILENLKKDLE